MELIEPTIRYQIYGKIIFGISNMCYYICNSVSSTSHPLWWAKNKSRQRKFLCLDLKGKLLSILN